MRSEDSASDRATRRTALAALAAPLAASAAGIDPLQALAVRARDKNAAFMSGDMQRWKALTPIARDFTLMQPFGGPATHGFDSSPQRMAEMSRYFRNGKTELELVQAHGGHDLAVLIMIERQTAEVGGLPAQDWSLRVTEVYRRIRDDWELLHRHADPLVKRISLEAASTLAKGSESEPAKPGT